MKDLMISNFIHVPPENYSYEFEEFKRDVISIWLRCHIQFDYNLGKPTKTIWGFYNRKKGTYYSPVNSKTVGDIVSIDNTTPYSAMVPKLNPLTACFV